MNAESSGKDELTEAVFVALQSKRALRLSARENNLVTVREVANWLYSYTVLEHDLEQVGIDSRICQAIQSDLSLYGAYKALLQARQRCSVGKLAAAASSDDEITFPGQAVTVILSRSKAEQTQFYIIVNFDASVQLAEGDVVKLVIEQEDQRIYTMTLPPVRNQRSQLLLTEEDPVVVALRSGDSKISFL